MLEMLQGMQIYVLSVVGGVSQLIKRTANQHAGRGSKGQRFRVLDPTDGTEMTHTFSVAVQSRTRTR